MGLLSKILPLVAIGAALALLANIFARPQSALASAGALGETGTAIGGTLSSLGLGASNLGGGIGAGLSGLLQPAWEIKNLFEAFSSNVAGSANISPVAQITGPTPGTGVPRDANGGRSNSSTITWSSGAAATVPTLSDAAKNYYSNLGVSVT